jgi:pilus assembly protein CpaF
MLNFVPNANNQALDEQTRKGILATVLDCANREFMLALRTPSPDQLTEVMARVSTLVHAELRRFNLAPQTPDIDALVLDLMRRLTGLGFLDALLPPVRSDLSEIAIYSSGLFQVMRKDQTSWETIPSCAEAGEVLRVLSLILGPQSKALTEATPEIRAKLPASPSNPGGGRVTALHPCIVPGSGYPCLNIRLFEQKPVRPEWLLERKQMTQEMMDYLQAAIASGQRILICGSTSSGKTTLLSALCNFLPPRWRTIKIEDPSEIWIDRPNIQTIEARIVPPGSEATSYTLRNGVDVAMRLSPDYLIVGEVRDGAAALALLRAASSGHPGSCTFHAESPADAFERLSMLMGTDCGISDQRSYQNIVSGIDLLVQLSKRGNRRQVSSIVKVDKKMHSGEPHFLPLFHLDEHSDPEKPCWTTLAEGPPPLSELEPKEAS